MYRDLALGYAAIAARDWRAARAPFERANAMARRREAASPRDRNARVSGPWCSTSAARMWRALAQEAVDLATTLRAAAGVDDAHPALGDRISPHPVAGLGGGLCRLPDPRRAPPVAAPSAKRKRGLIARSTALTPKEREVLELLARNLSNKEIGLTMNIHEDTVKWHVKNVFAKLSADTRKQVVSSGEAHGLPGASRLILGPAGRLPGPARLRGPVSGTPLRVGGHRGLCERTTLQ